MNPCIFTSCGVSSGRGALGQGGNDLASKEGLSSEPEKNAPPMPKHARAMGAVLEAQYRFTLWLVPTIARFWRNREFVPGDPIRAAALDVQKRLIEPTCYTRWSEYVGDVNPGRQQ